MKKALRHVSFSLMGFVSAIALTLVAGVVLLVTLGYEQSFLMLNTSGFGKPADVLFFYVTHLADGLVVVALIVVAGGWRRLRFTAIGLYGVIGSGLLAQLFKRFVFPDWQRPLAALGAEQVHHLPDLTLMHHSFPSGHATSAAVLGYVLALTRPRSYVWGVLMAGLTVAIGYSRIYLGVHFLGDVVAGCVLGLAWMLLMRWLKLEAAVVQFDKKYWSQKMTARSQAAVLVVGLLALGFGYGMAAS